jgi:hypothetical protein
MPLNPSTTQQIENTKGATSIGEIAYPFRIPEFNAGF